MNVNEIIQAKSEAGAGAYLWLHESGDCLLWASEAASIDDDGKRAIGRWQVGDDDRAALVRSGLVDAQA